jgi:hypothetical protein
MKRIALAVRDRRNAVVGAVAIYNQKESTMAEQLVRKPHMKVWQSLDESWKTYLYGLEKSLNLIEEGIREGEEMTHICTGEWCEATEHYLDEFANALFTIHEPEFSSPEDRQKIKDMKKRIHDIYARYKSIPKKETASA